jgi:hypothetical protein
MDATPHTYRLGSSPVIYAPGVVKWAQTHFRSAPELMTKVIQDGWGVPVEAAWALCAQTVRFWVEDDVVVFTTNAFMAADDFANE